MNPTLAKWSWAEIQRVYAALGRVLQSYEDVARRISVPIPHIDNSDLSNTFALRWNTDIVRINSQISALDQEIKRRNNLIGVIG